MFGKRSEATAVKTPSAPVAPSKEATKPAAEAPKPATEAPRRRSSNEPSEEYYETKATDDC